MEKELNHTALSSEETTSLRPTSRDQASGENPVADRSPGWPQRPPVFPDLMTPVEAAMFLRLDETGHTPQGRRGRRHQGRG